MSETREPRSRGAMVFPGMSPIGFADVGKFMVINPVARKLVARANEVLGFSLVDRYRKSTGDYAPVAQVAFLVNCLAVAEWARHTFDPEPEFCAGPSFGGKAAAVYSGALEFEDAVRMTAQWADVLEEYFALEHTDIVTHSFARTPYQKLLEILGELDGWSDISCHVDHDFLMVSLAAADLEWLQARVKSIGGVPLYTMRPPMHSGLFRPLRDRLEAEVFADLEFADPRTPMIADQDGAVLRTGDGVRRMLLDGVVRPVRWPDVVARLRSLDVGRLYVSGSDSLFGRVPGTRENFEVVAVDPRSVMGPRHRKGIAERIPAMLAD